ncbi:MAG: hypothetical protein DMF63_16965 [Acidobacteria bacterium]|nr:MAG: hypothetical protein DMF63_16965 [Acidobacteriota bacterium]
MSAKKLLAQVLVLCQAFAILLVFPVESVPQDGDRVPETIFSNPTNIAINSATSSSAPFAATLYPSNIAVSGMTGNITRVAVTLNGFNHTRSGDLDFLLVSPTGAKFIFLSDFNFGILDDKLFTFADDATTTLAGNVVDVASGSYKPFSGDSQIDSFPAPAPAGPYGIPPASTFASVFNGVSPNGTWSLFAVDDSIGEAGMVETGWALTITTDGSPATFRNTAVIGLNDRTMPSDPYGTAINISGQTGVISSLKIGLTGLSHTRLDDVDILLVSPNGKAVVVLSDAGFGTGANNVNLTFDDSAAGTVGVNPTSGSYRPTDQGDSTSGIDPFPNPAPIRPYHQFPNTLSNFNGFSPNGEWRLFVLDDNPTNSGSISGGWFLDITTAPAGPPTGAACAVPSFGSPTNFAAGNIPTNLAVADFNNDMKADIAVTNQVSNDVSILLGTGTGAFLPQTLITAGSGPYAIVAGKFNADSNFDLAVANSGSNNVSVFLGNGNGTFSAATNFFVGSTPISIADGDLNNDGKQDLAVANFGSFFSGSVSILIGNGTGGFTQGTTVRTRSQPSFVAIANLNSTDSNRDLVVTSFGSNSATTFFGNGNATFVVGQNLATPIGPVSVEVADLGVPDGMPDFVIANYNADSITTCFNTSPAGTFSCSGVAAGGPNPISVAADDYLGSGMKIPAVALSGSNILKVNTTNINVGANPNAVESADLNGDGRVDLISVNSGSNDVSVALNSCAVAVGNLFDWDGDKRTDFNVIRPSTQAWYNASLNQSVAAKYFSRPRDTLVPADYDGDGKTDYGLFRPESGRWIVHNGLNPRPIYDLQFGLADDIPSPADFDGDGKADLAVFRPSDGNWYVRRTSDNSTQVMPFGAAGDKPVAADYDADGKADVAVYRPSTGVWYISQSSDGQPVIIQFGVSEDKTVVGDYDGDRKADLAVWRPSTGVWWIRWSSDGGVRAFVWGTPGDIPVAGDYDSDGKIDPALWRPSDRNWYVLKSSDSGSIYFTWGVPTDYPIPNAFVR